MVSQVSQAGRKVHRGGRLANPTLLVGDGEDPRQRLQLALGGSGFV
jgi:hypothetical protein